MITVKSNENAIRGILRLIKDYRVVLIELGIEITTGNFEKIGNLVSEFTIALVARIGLIDFDEEYVLMHLAEYLTNVTSIDQSSNVTVNLSRNHARSIFLDAVFESAFESSPDVSEVLSRICVKCGFTPLDIMKITIRCFIYTNLVKASTVIITVRCLISHELKSKPV